MALHYSNVLRHTDFAINQGGKPTLWKPVKYGSLHLLLISVPIKLYPHLYSNGTGIFSGFYLLGYTDTDPAALCCIGGYCQSGGDMVDRVCYKCRVIIRTFTVATSAFSVFIQFVGHDITYKTGTDIIFEIVSLPEVKSLTIKDKLSSASGVHTTSCAETLSPFHAVRLMSFLVGQSEQVLLFVSDVCAAPTDLRSTYLNP